MILVTLIQDQNIRMIFVCEFKFGKSVTKVSGDINLVFEEIQDISYST